MSFLTLSFRCFCIVSSASEHSCTRHKNDRANRSRCFRTSCHPPRPRRGRRGRHIRRKIRRSRTRHTTHSSTTAFCILFCEGSDYSQYLPPVKHRRNKSVPAVTQLQKEKSAPLRKKRKKYPVQSGSAGTSDIFTHSSVPSSHPGSPPEIPPSAVAVNKNICSVS